MNNFHACSFEQFRKESVYYKIQFSSRLNEMSVVSGLRDQSKRMIRDRKFGLTSVACLSQM